MLNNQIPSECETCSTTQASLQNKEPKQSLRVFMGMWMCPTCEHKERELQKANNQPEVVQARLDTANLLVEKARAIDLGIQVREDVFNAQTVAIMDIKNAIWSNPEIPEDKKQLRFAEELHSRFTHLQKVIYDARVLLVEAGNEQRAIQQHMNTLANSLREEERNRLKLQDINYKPEIPKPIKIRTSNTGERKSRGKKFDKKELIDLAAQYNVPMEAIQMVATMRNLTAKQAAIVLNEQMHGNSN